MFEIQLGSFSGQNTDLLIMTQVSWSLFFVNVWSGQSGNWVCNGV